VDASASLNSRPNMRNIIRPYSDRGFKILTVDNGLPQIWISTFPSMRNHDALLDWFLLKTLIAERSIFEQRRGTNHSDLTFILASQALIVSFFGQGRVTAIAFSGCCR
jgi:hypothetical protein